MTVTTITMTITYGKGQQWQWQCNANVNANDNDNDPNNGDNDNDNDNDNVFQLGVFFNADEPTTTFNRGFHLHYHQRACWRPDLSLFATRSWPLSRGHDSLARSWPLSRGHPLWPRATVLTSWGHYPFFWRLACWELFFYSSPANFCTLVFGDLIKNFQCLLPVCLSTCF